MTSGSRIVDSDSAYGTLEILYRNRSNQGRVIPDKVVRSFLAVEFTRYAS